MMAFPPRVGKREFVEQSDVGDVVETRAMLPDTRIRSWYPKRYSFPPSQQHSL